MEEYYLLRVEGDSSRIIAVIEKEGAVVQKVEATNIVRQILREMKLPRSKGAHDYISYITLHHQPEWGALTNEIYPETAKEFGTTLDSVDKTIYRAIHDSWPHMPEKYKEHFHGMHSPPKPLEFLRVMRELAEEAIVHEFEKAQGQ